MKYFALPIICFSFFLLSASGCDKKTNTDALCNQITLNKPFTGRINEIWCLDEADWNITFGPFIEDSRCNVPNIECFWAGRFVMATVITTSEGVVRDTFYAQNSWSDTLHQGAYTIILKKVYPEVRTSMEALDPSKYSFDVVVSEQ
ncbi:MAG: hypothetical protein ABIQ02_00910 [Saprospiraceae bacterium]